MNTNINLNTNNPLPTNRRRRAAASAALIAAAALALSGCAGTSNATKEASSELADEIRFPVSFEDGWVKATDSDMSAVFGVLHNESDIEYTVTSATCSVGMMVELHEVVADASGNMVMQQKEGGFVIPAAGMHMLEPGADHIMLMGLSAPILPGDMVSCELTIMDGSKQLGTLPIEVPAKEFSGANESYDH